MSGRAPRSLCVIALAAVSLLSATMAAAAPQRQAARGEPGSLFSLTPWKAYHLLGGLASGLLAAAVVDEGQEPQLVASYPLYLPAVAFSTATAAGIGKEVLDSTGFGGAEFSDILITMAGGLLAAGFSAFVETRFPASIDGRQNAATVLAAAGAILSVPVIIAFIHEVQR